MKLRSAILSVAFAAMTSTAFADMAVQSVNTASLPFSMSPTNYDNSPVNFVNSISNAINANSNFNNSATNSENSKTNYANSNSGNRRLIYNGKYVGYYVKSPEGVTNFFTASGQRAFYNPPKMSGVFDTKGKYAGAVGNTSDRLTLALTADALKMLLSK